MLCDHEASANRPVRVLHLTSKTLEELLPIEDVWGDTYVHPPRTKSKGIVGYLWGAKVKVTKGKERTQ